jgi:hypothetical protein
MDVECDLTISFDASGNSLAFLGGGWARSEPGFTWSVGSESHLILPRIATANDCILTLDVIPCVHDPQAPSQRLIVSINDTVAGSSQLSRPTLLGYRIPAGLAQQSERMLVTLQHPDAVRPKDFGDSADDRQLAFAISEARLHRVASPKRSSEYQLPAGLMLGAITQRDAGPPADLREWAMAQTGLTIPQIAFTFESIGENCEFGLFQRQCDAEPLGLLRFSSTFMRNLMRGVERGFQDLGEIEDIEPRLEGTPRKEFMIHEKKYGLVYHTFVYEGERSVWLMREQEAARLKFLRRKFLEELEAAEKIFIYQFSGPMSEEEILPLYLALNRYGPATLLWVVPAELDRPAGTVEVLMPRLMKGHIDRFAPGDNAHDLSFDGWLRVCTNACVLHRLQNFAMQAADRAAVTADPIEGATGSC